MKSRQNVVIFGAAGRVGSLLVEYALTDGYDVTAFVHRHHNLPDHPHLRIVTGDVYASVDVEKAIADADVVMSALSSWGTTKKDVLSSAMQNIIPAMQHHKVTRIISLTGADARAPGDKLSIVHRMTHLMIHIVAGKVLADGERHIQLLAASDLDWTVIRSPVMQSSKSQKYRLTQKRPGPWAMVSRRSVARTMVDQISDEGSSRQALFVVK